MQPPPAPDPAHPLTAGISISARSRRRFVGAALFGDGGRGVEADEAIDVGELGDGLEQALPPVIVVSAGGDRDFDCRGCSSAPQDGLAGGLVALITIPPGGYVQKLLGEVVARNTASVAVFPFNAAGMAAGVRAPAVSFLEFFEN